LGKIARSHPQSNPRAAIPLEVKKNEPNEKAFTQNNTLQSLKTHPLFQK